MFKINSWSIFLILLVYIFDSECIMWHLDPNTHKCLKEELHQNVPVTGEFEVSEAVNQKVDYVVFI